MLKRRSGRARKYSEHRHINYVLQAMFSLALQTTLVIKRHQLNDPGLNLIC